MSIKTPLYNKLVADPALNALVDDRVYRKIAPENPTLPYVTYFSVDRPRIHLIRYSTDIVQERVQVDCWAATDGAAQNVADAIREELDGFVGNMGGTRVLGCTHVDESDTMEAPLAASETPIHRVRQDYMISYVEI